MYYEADPREMPEIFELFATREILRARKFRYLFQTSRQKENNPDPLSVEKK